MALPVRPVEALTIIPQYNVNPYDEASNPYGFDNGGHIYNHLQSFRYVVQIENYLTALTGYVEGLRQDIADDLADTNQDVIDTAAARERARQFANAPEDQDLGNGEFSARHFMEKSKDQVGLAKDEVTKAAGKVTEATTEANRSKTEADRGKGYADAQNVPGMTAGDAGKFLRVNAAGNGYLFDGVGEVFRVARTANTALVKADKGKLIDITSGTFAQTFAGVATLGDGWSCFIRNGGTGDITLDPNGSETIDGIASFIMYPGEVRLIQCDATALRSIILSPGTKTFTTSGNLLWPPGVKGAVIECWGAGGGGGYNPNGSDAGAGGGGGGGKSPPVIVQPKSAGTAVTVAVGASGIGGTVGADPTAGGASLFGSLGSQDFCYAEGGGPGNGSSYPYYGGFGGGGGLNVPFKGGEAATGLQGGARSQNNAFSAEYGGGGGGSHDPNPRYGYSGGSSVFGGGGGGAGGNSYSGSGGVSGRQGAGGGASLGSTASAAGGGAGASPATPAGNGGFPGGGGGGGGPSPNQNGGNGGAGQVRVRFF